MKSLYHNFFELICRRSPHGERGLKCYRVWDSAAAGLSLPAWGAWIEIGQTNYISDSIWSLPAWGAWIEINIKLTPFTLIMSLPAWGAWIEIVFVIVIINSLLVAPRMGSVD